MSHTAITLCVAVSPMLGLVLMAAGGLSCSYLNFGFGLPCEGPYSLSGTQTLSTYGLLIVLWGWLVSLPIALILEVCKPKDEVDRDSY